MGALAASPTTGSSSATSSCPASKRCPTAPPGSSSIGSSTTSARGRARGDRRRGPDPDPSRPHLRQADARARLDAGGRGRLTSDQEALEHLLPSSPMDSAAVNVVGTSGTADGARPSLVADVARRVLAERLLPLPRRAGVRRHRRDHAAHGTYYSLLGAGLLATAWHRREIIDRVRLRDSASSGHRVPGGGHRAVRVVPAQHRAAVGRPARTAAGRPARRSGRSRPHSSRCPLRPRELTAAGAGARRAGAAPGPDRGPGDHARRHRRLPLQSDRRPGRHLGRPDPGGRSRRGALAPARVSSWPDPAARDRDGARRGGGRAGSRGPVLALVGRDAWRSC